MDEIAWTRIIDYRAYLCRSWQKLYFAPVVATFVIEIDFYFRLDRLFFFRSIRIVGTHNTVNKVFHLVSMEVYYIQKPFALVGDIYGK